MERNEKRSGIVRRAILVGALGLALAGLATVSAQARGPGWEGREPSPDRIAARMAERLGLTAEQRTKVQKILAENSAKRSGIREEARKKLEGLRTETDKRFSEMLTPDQMTRLAQLREERSGHRSDRRSGCSPWAGGPEGGIPPEPPGEND